MFSKIKTTAKNSFLYSIGNIAGKMSGIILLPLYMIYLPAEMFGLYSLFEITYQFINALTGMGIKVSLSRWYWDKEMEGQKKELFFSAFVFNLMMSVITITILFAGFNLLSVYLFKTEISNELKVVFLLSTFIRLVVDMPMILLRVTHKAATYTHHQLIQLVTFVATTSLFVAYYKLEILGIFLGFLISNGINFLMLIPYTLRNIKWNYKKQVVKEMLTYGFPLAMSNLINLVLSMSDKVVISIFATLKHVGNYALAFKISNIVELVVVNSFMGAYVNIFFKGMDETGNERFFAKSFTYFIFILTIISMGLVLFIKDIIAFLIAIMPDKNQDYLGSINLIPILTLSIIFGGARLMLVLPLQRYKKTKIISIVSVSLGVSNLILNVLLVPVFGSMGAAIATMVTQIAASSWLLQYNMRLDKTPYEVKKIAIMLGTGILLGSAGVFAPIGNILIHFALNIMIIMLWLTILYFTNFFEQVELMRLHQAWVKWKNPLSWKKNLSKEKNE